MINERIEWLFNFVVCCDFMNKALCVKSIRVKDNVKNNVKNNKNSIENRVKNKVNNNQRCLFQIHI